MWQSENHDASIQLRALIRAFLSFVWSLSRKRFSPEDLKSSQIKSHNNAVWDLIVVRFNLTPWRLESKVPGPDWTRTLLLRTWNLTWVLLDRIWIRPKGFKTWWDVLKDSRSDLIRTLLDMIWGLSTKRDPVRRIDLDLRLYSIWSLLDSTKDLTWCLTCLYLDFVGNDLWLVFKDFRLDFIWSLLDTSDSNLSSRTWDLICNLLDSFTWTWVDMTSDLSSGVWDFT